MKTITTAATLSSIVKAEIPALEKTLKSISKIPAKGVRKIKAERAIKLWLGQFSHLVVAQPVAASVSAPVAVCPEVKVPVVSVEDNNWHPNHDWGYAQLNKFFMVEGIF